MEPMLTEFRWVAEAMSYSAPRIPVISNRTGTVADAQELCSPDYWVSHVRQPVRFADGVRSLAARGVRTFLELGPDGVLSSMVHDCLADSGEEILAVPVLRRDRQETRQLTTAVAEAYARGVQVDWSGFFAGTGARAVDLPTYPFQRQRYWLTSARPGGAADLGLGVPRHPLLTAIVTLAEDDRLVLTGRLSRQAQPWLADHVVAGQVLVPGTAFLDLAIRAGDEVGCPVIRELTLQAPLALPEQGATIQLSVGVPDETGARSVFFFSRPAQAPADSPWTRHASGVLAPADSVGEAQIQPAQTRSAQNQTAQWPPAGATEQDLAGLYPALAEAGLAYGPVFRGVQAAWRRGQEIFVEVSLPEGTDVTGFAMHPALLDAGLHMVDASGAGVEVPFAWTDVAVHAAGATRLRVTIAPAATGPGVSLTLADPAGDLVASVGSVVFRELPAGSRDDAASVVRDSLFTVDWVPVPAPVPVPSTQPAAGPTAVLGQDTGLAVPGAARHADLAALMAAVAAGEPAPGLVIACCTPPVPAQADAAAAARQLAAGLLGLLQVLAERTGHGGLAAGGGDLPGGRRRAGGGRRSGGRVGGGVGPLRRGRTPRPVRPGGRRRTGRGRRTDRGRGHAHRTGVRRPRRAAARAAAHSRRAGPAGRRAGLGAWRDGADHRRDRRAGRPGGPAPGRQQGSTSAGAGITARPGGRRPPPRSPPSWPSGEPGCGSPPATWRTGTPWPR